MRNGCPRIYSGPDDVPLSDAKFRVFHRKIEGLLRKSTLISAFSLSLLTFPALAQQHSPPPSPAQPQQQQTVEIDPRITKQAIAAMQAMLELKDAQLKAMQEDAQKREHDWAEYSKSLWQSDESKHKGPMAGSAQPAVPPPAADIPSHPGSSPPPSAAKSP
jgi:hypothetical protein